MKKIIVGTSLALIIVFTGIAHGSIAGWLQMPSLDPLNGYAFSSETQVASQVADDFPNLHGYPIAAITWWGSYWDTTYGGSSYYPYRHSDAWGDPGPSEIVTGFNLTFYQDVPAGSAVPPWSHPGGTVEKNYYMALGDIRVQEYAVIPRPSSIQTVYQYDIDLDIPLVLAPGNIFWLSIQAVDDNGNPVQWGWQESVTSWNDNAVQTFPGNPFLWDMLPGENMAFELKTVPVPSALLLAASGLLGLMAARSRT